MLTDITAEGGKAKARLYGFAGLQNRDKRGGCFSLYSLPTPSLKPFPFPLSPSRPKTLFVEYGNPLHVYVFVIAFCTFLLQRSRPLNTVSTTHRYHSAPAESHQKEQTQQQYTNTQCRSDTQTARRTRTHEREDSFLQTRPSWRLPGTATRLPCGRS